MPKSVLWIRAVGTDELDTTIKEFLDREKARDVEIKTVSLSRGPLHLEYRFYEALVLPDVLHWIKRADQEGYDGAVVGCYYDVGLLEGREIAERLVMTGPAEASMHIGATLGHSFSIILGRRKWIPRMLEVVHRYGFTTKLCSLKAIDFGAPDLQSDPEETQRRFKEAALEAIERDGAEVILLGCTMGFGFYRALQADLGVPVIDPLLAPLKYLELLMDLKARFKWGPSRIGLYQPPQKEEIEGWDLEGQYGWKDGRNGS
ncbi:MAG: hydantoin racemase [Deltaproteobacteria bacterium]|nr:hydantoin racemase [Deltaproteobacteria bacterium]MBW2303724.1 hydantoin racemase [Deltaproteobacteria bacterium]